MNNFVQNMVAVSVVGFLLLPLFGLGLSELRAGDQAPVRGPSLDWWSLGASLLVAAASAAVAVAIGGTLAGLFVLTDFPGRTLWATVCLIPFVTPPAVWALGQVYCYGPGGMIELVLGDGWRPTLTRWNPGRHLSTILVLAQIHAPLAMVVLGRSMTRLHRAGWESACLCLPPFRLGAWTIRALRNAWLAACLLTFALALGNFSVPHVLQCQLYTIGIYTRMANYLDPSGSVRAAVPLLLITVSAAVLFAWTEGRPVRTLPGTPPGTRLRLGRWIWVCGPLLFAYVVITSALPMLATLRQCRSWPLFLRALRDAVPETENTLLIAGAAAGTACLAGITVGAWLTFLPRWVKRTLTVVPLGVPGLVIGLAYVRYFNREGPFDLILASGSMLVVMGLAFRIWPFAQRIVTHGIEEMPQAWHEAAVLGGLTGWRRRWWIAWPLLRGDILAAAVIGFVLALGEVEISQMLCAPGQGTLALRLFTFLHFGPTHVAASLAVLLWGIALLPVFLYFLLLNRFLPMV
jgi:ABC-type Fe3+ transport system permease subunit